MVAHGGDVVATREILHHLHVGGQARPGEHPLEQVVAQKGLLRHAPIQGALEGVDVIDALAGIGPLAE